MALLGLLFTLPLALILWLAYRESGQEPSPAEVSPMLSEEEVRPLHTFWRRCERSEDCEPPLGCLPKPTRTEGVCSDSWCQTDLQCEEQEMVCRTLSPLGNGPLVRVCVWPGRRKEGEACSESWDSARSACARGLLCNQGWCGRPCRREDPSVCPEGFLCRDGLEGPSCVPTCEGRTCPQGQQCVHLKPGVSVCATVHGEASLQQPCPEGETCLLGDPLHTPSGLTLWRTCAQPCGRGQPPCPEGSPCIEGMCRHRCNPQAPEACGPHEKCHPLPRSFDAGVCMPRYR